jgi:hypothetical protein
MEHLEVSGAVVLYIGRTVSKGLQAPVVLTVHKIEKPELIC